MEASLAQSERPELIEISSLTVLAKFLSSDELKMGKYKPVRTGASTLEHGFQGEVERATLGRQGHWLGSSRKFVCNSLGF